MTDSELHQSVKRRLQLLRPYMVGLKTDQHWLRLHKMVRSVLAEGFKGGISDENLAHFVHVPKSVMESWHKQCEQLVALKEKIAKLATPGRGKFARSSLYKADVAALARLLPVNRLAKELGLPRSSVLRWSQEGWENVMVEGQEWAAPKGLDTAIAVDPSVATISVVAPRDQALATPEGRELTQLLNRHTGKARWKYSVTEKKLLLVLIERFGSKAVHDAFSISFDTIARMIRHQKLDLERKVRVPVRYAPVLDLMKQHPGMGPMQVRDYLRRHMGLSMSVNSIRKVMEEHGWVPPFIKSPRLKEGVQFYEAVRRNYLWHTDFKHQYINSCKVFLIFLQDDYSRFIVNFSVADGEKVDVVMVALDEAVRLHGKPEVLMSDGGSAFYSWRGVSQLTRLLEDYGIDQHIAKTPNVNGKLENLNQQVEKELLLVNSFASLQHFEKELAAWVAFYNFRRPHQGLGGHQVPADRFYPGAVKWYGEASNAIKQQSLIAETMATLLAELKKPK